MLSYQLFSAKKGDCQGLPGSLQLSFISNVLTIAGGTDITSYYLTQKTNFWSFFCCFPSLDLKLNLYLCNNLPLSMRGCVLPFHFFWIIVWRLAQVAFNSHTTSSITLPNWHFHKITSLSLVAVSATGDDSVVPGLPGGCFLISVKLIALFAAAPAIYLIWLGLAPTLHGFAVLLSSNPGEMPFPWWPCQVYWPSIFPTGP